MPSDSSANNPSVPVGSTTPLSNLQWYLDRSANVVYFLSERDEDMTPSELERLTDCLLDSAPYLMSAVDAKFNHHTATKVPTNEICHFQSTSNLKTSLQETFLNTGVVYDDPALPNLRAFGFQLENPGSGESRSVLLFLASHALMEGAEASRIVRGRKKFKTEDRPATALSLATRLAVTIGSKLLGPGHLMASAFNKRVDNTEHIAIIDLDRKDVRRLSKRLNVRQRSLLFALPLHGLRSDSLEKGKRPKSQTVGYTMLPKSKEKLGDAAMKFRMQFGSFATAETFEQFVTVTNSVLDRENITEAFGPALYDSILGLHRFLDSIFPFFYGRRFFTFVPYDFVLSLVPPHVASGPMRDNLKGPIHCGSNSPGVDACVIVPHRTGFSLNLSLDRDAHARIDSLTALLDEVGIAYRRVL